MKPFCLTIAGSDPTSGAGIQADIRTFDNCGVHPFSVITAITYQSAKAFFGFSAVSEDNLKDQLEAVLKNYPIKCVKIGMIPNEKSVDIIAEFIEKYNLNAIYDPVTISSAGKRLSNENLEQYLERRLFPLIKILTPNISEAEVYSGKSLRNLDIKEISKIKEAALVILEKMYFPRLSKIPTGTEKAVIIKSVNSDEEKIIDLVLINKLIDNKWKKEYLTYEKRRIFVKGNIHGTGCVFSSAVAAFLAKDNSIEEAIDKAEIFFDEKFQTYVEFPDQGKVIDLTVTNEKLKAIEEVKKIYNYISQKKEFAKLIPEVRLNISGSLPNAKYKDQIAGIEGRVTIIDGYPYAAGSVKFGVSDHTARLILAAKESDDSINFAMNLKYKAEYIKEIQERTNLSVYEFKRELEPETLQKQEHSTMLWVIKESVKKIGMVPNIIWDKGAVGKEAMIRLFGKTSEDMIEMISKILDATRELGF